MSARTRPDVDLNARCACGAVAVAVKGPVQAMFLCACRTCQVLTGTGHSAVVLVDAAGVTLAGETRAFSRPAESGATFTHRFCPACGTQLTGQSTRAPAMLLLPVGLFAGQSDWFAPGQVIFARSHNEWDALPDGLPRYDTYRKPRP